MPRDDARATLQAEAREAVARSIVLGRESQTLVARVAAEREERRLVREDRAAAAAVRP